MPSSATSGQLIWQGRLLQTGGSNLPQQLIYLFFRTDTTGTIFSCLLKEFLKTISLQLVSIWFNWHLIIYRGITCMFVNRRELSKHVEYCLTNRSQNYHNLKEDFFFMWRRSKWLSFLLVFSIMFLAVAPQSTFASTGSSQNPGSQGPVARRTKNITHLAEMVEKRDQHTKYYRNSDGSITAETTINSRHYKDAQGQMAGYLQ